MIGRLRELAARGALAVDTFRKTGVGHSFSLRGMGEFVSDPRAIPRGPTRVLHFYACQHPDKPALVDVSRGAPVRLSYRELDQEVNRIANALTALGVTTGERVAVMMRNCREYLLAQWAVARAGGAVVQVGYRSKAAEVSWFLENSRPRAFLFQEEYREIVEEARKQVGVPDERAVVGVPDGLQALAATGDPLRPPRPPEAHGGLIVYTSGTTGRPKGASRDFKKSLHNAVMDLIRQVGVHNADRHLVVCPLYHSAAPAFVAVTYAVGGTVILAEHFEPEAFLETVARERATSAFLVPTMLGRLTALPDEVRRRYDVSSLRWLLSGAAPLPTETARRIEADFGPILFNFYGATETGMVTLACPGEHTARPGTIGRALMGNEIRLYGEDGREVPVGEVGEMFVRSSMLVEGYHGDAAATRGAMKDGFFSVGDMARVDADGYYYLADRKHDMVISGGVNIYPQEIEQHLHNHPAILESAVIGIPDPDWGESLKAFVVLRPGARLDLEELRRYCRSALADYKCPKHVQFVDALPRNPTGKVLKRELKKESP